MNWSFILDDGCGVPDARREREQREWDDRAALLEAQAKTLAEQARWLRIGLDHMRKTDITDARGYRDADAVKALNDMADDIDNMISDEMDARVSGLRSRAEEIRNGEWE